MKFEELSKKTENELEKLLSDSREKLRQMRFDLVSGKVKNIIEIRQLKKSIAQILTILKNK
jgi:large subunit ribosomal protein L29